jgi:glycosyltransferase involved in cell wall biosynthesis
MKKIKISFLLSHPIQYFAPLLQSLGKEKELDFKVYYCSDHGVSQKIDKEFGRVVAWDIPILEGYQHEFIKNSSTNPSVTNFWGLINFDIFKKLKKDKPDILIVHGWGYFTHWFTIFVASLLGIEIWLRGEAPLKKEENRSFFVKTLRYIFIQNLLFKLVNRFLYIGTENKLLYQFFGSKVDKLIFTPYSIDNQRFANLYENIKNDKDKNREALGLNKHQIVFLFCGKLIEIKNPFLMLEAYKKIQTINTALVVVGDGKLRENMEAYIKKHDLLNVKMVGFKNQSEIANYYALSDVLLLTSKSETWGLVVNEAMNFEMSFILSSGVGCAKDLIHENENGFIFENGHVDDLANKMRFMIENPSFLPLAAAKSKEIIALYSVETTIKNIKTALQLQ